MRKILALTALGLALSTFSFAAQPAPAPAAPAKAEAVSKDHTLKCPKCGGTFTVDEGLKAMEKMR